MGGSGSLWGVRVDVNEALKFCENSKKKFWGGGGGGRWGGRWGIGVGGQSGCERRIEVFVKIQKKKNFFGGGGRGGGGVGGSGWGVRVDVNEELKFL